MTGAYKFIHTKLMWAVKFFYQLSFVGSENEPDEGPLLVCSNHISAADPFLVSAATRNQISYMAKKELFGVPLVGRLLKSVGSFPVDRKGSDVSAVKRAISILKDGGRVGIFPQGTRRPGEDPRSTEVKNGAAMIAVRAEVDILPVFVHRKNNKPRLFRKTTVIVGKPIKFSELGYDPEKSGEYARIAQLIFDEVCRLGEDFVKCQK